MARLALPENPERSFSSSHISASSSSSFPSPPNDSFSRRQKKKCCSSPTSRRGKTSLKDVDWADVRDPEERRRIQNRIAQRKFREKAREQRERAEREAQNQEHAANIYRIAPASMEQDHLGIGERAEAEELSGLPWGGIHLGHLIARGHEAENLRSSGRGSHVGHESLTGGNLYAMPYGSAVPGPHHYHQSSPSFGSSGPDDVFYQNTSYMHSHYTFP